LLLGSTYWVQGSYDKRPANERCDPNNDAAECLLAIDKNTGELINATFTNYTIYHFANTPNANGTVLAFAYGFEGLCKHPYEDFLFVNVNLTDATASPIGCIPNNVTIQVCSPPLSPLRLLYFTVLLIKICLICTQT
jgi:hypothetical protein